MKKTILLNSEISDVISRMGHTDTLVIADAGLPIPRGVKRIDLAVMKGIPSFDDVLAAVLSELEVQKITMAGEMREKNYAQYRSIMNCFSEIKIEEIPHEQLKKHTQSAIAVIRTGECRPYANVILESGVTF